MKRVNGTLEVVIEADIATYGAATSTAFRRVFAETGENATEYFDRINMRNKLNPQKFSNLPEHRHLVLVGAGGEHICAAYVPMSKVDQEKTIIDQTLYWYVAESEDEALYICGLLNSHALGVTIADFQPEGAMGRRHIHKLPYEVTPPYDADNPAHMAVAENTHALKEALERSIPTSNVAQYLPPSRSTLQVRRNRIRGHIHSLPESEAYEEACKGVYDI